MLREGDPSQEDEGLQVPKDPTITGRSNESDAPEQVVVTREDDSTKVMSATNTEGIPVEQNEDIVQPELSNTEVMETVEKLLPEFEASLGQVETILAEVEVMPPESYRRTLLTFALKIRMKPLFLWGPYLKLVLRSGLQNQTEDMQAAESRVDASLERLQDAEERVTKLWENIHPMVRETMSRKLDRRKTEERAKRG